VEQRNGEICSKQPGFEEDLVVMIEDPQAFVGWHLGLVGWEEALRSGGIRVEGPRDLARALPTWNAGPQAHSERRQGRSPTPSWLALHT
jgi:hypothetical protein